MKDDQHPIPLDEMAEGFRKDFFVYIRTKVGDRSAADDLTQETFLKVQNSLSKGLEPEHFRGRQYLRAPITLDAAPTELVAGETRWAIKIQLLRSRSTAALNPSQKLSDDALQAVKY